MTIHQCGDSDLDPMNCPACHSGDRVPSGSALVLAARAMGRLEAGLCVGCAEPIGDRESAWCAKCDGEDE